MLKTNYHTHSTFCDGKDSLEDMIKEAIKLKFDILGFSGHSMYPFASSWHIPVKNLDDYSTSLKQLKKLYEDKIKILIGFEADFIRGICSPDLSIYKKFDADYTIGSVHIVPSDRGFFEADGNPLETKKLIKDFYDGNVKEAVHTYFEEEREMVRRGGFTFLGHLDLIRKQNTKKDNNVPLFSESETWYKDETASLAKEIARSGLCVEINTGGMARGYLDAPYPSFETLELLHSLNVPITINSDAHTLCNLDYGFKDSMALALKAGYKEVFYYTEDGLKAQPIEL